MPIRMNPMIRLIRILAKAGMTSPAAPRITSASLKPDVLNWLSIALFKQPRLHLSRKQLQLIGRRHDVRSRFDRRWRRPGWHDGGPAFRSRRLPCAGAGEARRLLPRFSRRYGPSLDDGNSRPARDAPAFPE